MFELKEFENQKLDIIYQQEKFRVEYMMPDNKTILEYKKEAFQMNFKRGKQKFENKSTETALKFSGPFIISFQHHGSDGLEGVKVEGAKTFPRPESDQVADESLSKINHGPQWFEHIPLPIRIKIGQVMFEDAEVEEEEDLKNS